jgi:hypothetical protein
MVGGSGDDGSKGALWAFTRAGATWTQQGTKLTATGSSGTAELGLAVALTADGNTALAGGPVDDGYVGAAWVFTRSGSTWMQQGSKLTGAGESGAGRFGSRVALARDGATALVAGPYDGAQKGAVWAFNSTLPAVSALSPSSGPAAGGNLVRVTGSNLSGATTVRFGTANAVPINVISAQEVSAVAPRGKAGAVDVIVTTPTGTSTANASARYTYTGGAATPNPIVARVAFANVAQKRGVRTLTVRLRVSVGGTATVRLLRSRAQKLSKLFVVTGGTNDLKATLPRSLKRGTHQIEITLADGKGHERVYRTTVFVPARA